MKYALITLIAGIFSLLVAGYLVVSIQIPISQDEFEQLSIVYEIEDVDYFYQVLAEDLTASEIFRFIPLQRVLLVLVTFSLGVTFIFASLHMSLDKLFFKEFYQAPSYMTAARRSGLVGTLVVAVYFLRVFEIELEYIAAILGLIIVLELLLSNLYGKWRQRRYERQQEKSAVESTTETKAS